MSTATTKRIEIGWNTWYQIHTNGGATTFARIYRGYNDVQQACVFFEKMSADHTNKTLEVFGLEEFVGDLSAQDRLNLAIEGGI